LYSRTTDDSQRRHEFWTDFANEADKIQHLVTSNWSNVMPLSRDYEK